MEFIEVTSVQVAAGGRSHAARIMINAAAVESIVDGGAHDTRVISFVSGRPSINVVETYEDLKDMLDVD